MKEHRLREFVDLYSPEITDEELDQVELSINFDDYQNNWERYDNSDNFIFTKDKIDRDKAMTHMCCGIISEDIELFDSSFIYFAFDYGH